MDRPEHHRRSAQNIGIGLIMGIAIGIGFAMAFDDALLGMFIGIITGLLLFGGLTFGRTR